MKRHRPAQQHAFIAGARWMFRQCKLSSKIPSAADSLIRDVAQARYGPKCISKPEGGK